MKVNGFSASTDTSLQTKIQTNDENISMKKAGQTLPSDVSVNLKTPKDEMTISDKVIINAIEKANKALEGPNKRFEFSIHKATHEIMVKVLNNDTGEVIREIPPEKILDMVAKLWEMAGIVVDERR